MLKNIIKILFILILLSALWLKVNASYYYNDYKKYDKAIRINTYSEKLSYYEKGEKIWEFEISSWDKDNYTPAWRFRIMNKHPMMWSKSAEKWMPNWLEFYDWAYGIHWLPLDSKYKQEKTEEEIIWLQDWGWCVRVWDKNIKALYEWADYGTVVLIAYDLAEYETNTDGESIIFKYFWYINDRKYQDAFGLKKYKNYSFWLFRRIYSWLEIKNIKVTKLESSKYQSELDIYKNWYLYRRWIKSIFYIWWSEIVNSYVVR